MGLNRKILIVAAECTPFAKTGGLADVVGALPKALASAGHEVRVIIPWYRKQVDVDTYKLKFGKGRQQLQAPLGQSGQEKSFDTAETTLPGSNIPVTLIDQPVYFDRESLYGTSQGDFTDNADRFIFFCQAALEATRQSKWKPDIIHCNDWHTALIPIYLKTLLVDDPFFAGIASLMTIHNLAYQGLFSSQDFERIGLPGNLYTSEGLEFYGQVNFLKGGVLFADRINTVSKRYAEEIQTAEFGCGLEGVLSSRREYLSGIVNGLDYATWAPEHDGHLQYKFGAETLDLKEAQKKAYLEEQGLEYEKGRPLLGMVTRLDSMKGLGLLEEIMDYLLNLDLQIAILGTGDPRIEDWLASVHATYPDRLSIHLTFSDRLAHQIEAASDIFLMPSRFEPCGLNQLISLRYGTVPVVRATGGLADTIEDFNDDANKGTGFTFHEYASMPFFHAIKRAVDLYKHNPVAWRQLQARCMAQDYSWSASGRAYLELYEKALEKG